MDCNETLNRKTRRALRARLFKHLSKRSRAFDSGEDGGMSIVAFFIFLLMVTMGGISIDVMRHEMERTQLQATLDSAVLAGAGAPGGSTKADIKAIVEDFFIKSGQGDYLNTIGDDDIVATLNARRVTASADMTLDTYLMKLMGVDTLTAAGGATAEVRTPKLEIVMVLDVSGSMANNSRLVNLKVAAKEFVTTVLASSDPGSTVISIVPFSWGVTPTQGIYDALSVDETHNYSTCLFFEDDDYLTPKIYPAPVAGVPGMPTVTYKQRIYTSYRGNSFDGITDGLITDGWSANYNRTCFTDPYFEILPFSINETVLHGKIDGLKAAGSTSGHLGVKWAAGMLDPAFRPVITSLQTPRAEPQDDGTIAMITEMDPSLSNIPALYSEPDTQKVIVMMGDGKNDSTFMFTDVYNHLNRDIPTTQGSADYRGPNSYLHKVVTVEQEFEYAYDENNHSRQWHQSWAEQYCWYDWLICVYDDVTTEDHFVFNPNNDRYYPVDGSNWISESNFDNWIDGLPDTYTDANGDEQDTHTNYGWEEAWGRMSPRFVRDLTGNWGPWNNFSGNVQTTSVKDDKMDDVCTATKAEDVLVYTIGFEVDVDSNAEVELRKCSSSKPGTSSHYYRASGVDITTAFGSIASNIQNLRLTQ